MLRQASPHLRSSGLTQGLQAGAVVEVPNLHYSVPRARDQLAARLVEGHASELDALVHVELDDLAAGVEVPHGHH